MSKTIKQFKNKEEMIKFCAKTIIQKPGAKRLPRGLVLLRKVLNACKISPTKNTEGRLRNWESYWKNYNKEEGFKGLRECEGGKNCFVVAASPLFYQITGEGWVQV